MILIPARFEARQGQPPIVPPRPGDQTDTKLPNGKSQHDEMLKADYKRNLEDSAQLAKLAGEIREDIEKDEKYVVSVKTLKKIDDMEKLLKTIRGQLKRY